MQSGPWIGGSVVTVRQAQQIEELCAATLRALTGDGELRYAGHRLQRGSRVIPVHAPHLQTNAAADDFAACRAAADGMALRLLHSDPELHRRHCPSDPVERLIFELLEQLRVETLVPAAMPGMAGNLRQRFEEWSRAFHESGLTDSSLGILLYTVTQICWSRLHAVPVLEEDLIETTRAGIAAVIGTPLAGLRRTRHDQAAFALHALAIAHIVGERVRAEDEDSRNESESAQAAAKRGFALLLDFDRDEAETFPAANSGESKTFKESESGYRVFTTRFDVEVNAASLVRKALLNEYRQRLDARVARQGINLARLARVFAAVLTTPERDGWRFDEEDGRIDGRRLAQLVSSPAERRLFCQEHLRPRVTSAVGILIDCSGSMTGLSETLATLVDILVRALDMAGVDSEVLGFTTGAWNGGRAWKEWQAQGRPPQPGRLNEVCHLVFKTAERNWRRSRPDIAALLKADLFREGIDGEAVDWACDRLLARMAERRILLVISDGCPMDSATGLANDAFYLDNHLKEVVARRERQGKVEILGLGVGLDLSPFYRRVASANFAQELDNQLFFDIAGLLRKR
ncbi:MAG: cobalt chelatase [Pseudomonadota bacterium]